MSEKEGQLKQKIDTLDKTLHESVKFSPPAAVITNFEKVRVNLEDLKNSLDEAKKDAIKSTSYDINADIIIWVAIVEAWEKWFEKWFGKS